MQLFCPQASLFIHCRREEPKQAFKEKNMLINRNGFLCWDSMKSMLFFYFFFSFECCTVMSKNKAKNIGHGTS